jgi:serine protease Do
LALLMTFHVAGACAASPDLAESEQQALVEAAQHAAPSVVQIRTVGGLERVGAAVTTKGPTTGLIIREDGYIASSAFNFAQLPASILVRLPDGRQAPAKLVGLDDNRMLALLKVESETPLPVPRAAPLNELRPGDWAVAVGRTYDAEHVDLSVGVVSAVRRMLGRAVQTDASVSPANYGGPLVDLRGRVIGVLSPMSPELGGASGEASAAAGVEYYDSGIGFAIPLAHILEVLPRWIEEGDLHRGLLGVGFKKGSPHATPPEVAAVWPDSPAAKAGWRAGDVIVSVEGRPVATQTQVRIEVVPHYAGDQLEARLRREVEGKSQEISTRVQLTAKLAPYRHACLGAIFTRPSARQAGVERKEPAETPQGALVRAVWPGSPAAKAGLRNGDRICRIDGVETPDAAAVRAAIDAKQLGDAVELVVKRRAVADADDGVETELKISLAIAPLQEGVLTEDELWPAKNPASGAPPGTFDDLKLPDFPNTALVIEPASDRPACGAVVWLGDAEEAHRRRIAESWQTDCRRDGLALVVAAPSDADGWTGDDSEYLGRLIAQVAESYAPEPRRLIIVGQGRAGQMAYTAALQSRGVASGVVAIDSPLPRGRTLPDNSPNQRLEVLSVDWQNTPLSVLIRSDVEKLRSAGYSVTQITRQTSGDARTVDEETRQAVARWIAGLERL